tara:strand:- start:1148 stop:2131 length:984 start_codon:yes stop_codon:yes gene_type:complete
MLSNDHGIFKDDPWSGILKNTYPSGRRLYLNDERFWVSRDSLNQLVFYVHDVCTTVIPIIESLSAVDIEVEKYQNNEQRLVCTFLESSAESFEKFSLAIKYIAVSSEKLAGIALFAKIQKELFEWADFLKINKKELTQNELIGFWGELYAIKTYIMKYHDAVNVIRYWTGPSGAKKDISLNSLAIEVKTTKASQATEIKISSLDQLERTTDNLYLMHLFINDADKDSGLSVSYLYESIRSKVQHDLKALALFTRYAGNIYNRASLHQKSECFLCSTANMYAVLDNFPTLLRSNLEGIGIVKANYSISISSIQSFKVTQNLEEIIKNG